MRQILSQYATAILLENATEVYYKIRQIFLLQNVTVITNCDDFITKCNSYYNMPRLLQIATVHTISNKRKSFEFETLLIAFILGWFHQCITDGHQRTTRHPFVHYSALLVHFFPYFTVAIYLSSCPTFFMLHFFHTTLFPYCTFLCSDLFMLHFSSCCALFMYCTISCCTFTCAMFPICILLLLHSSDVAIFSCCTLFMLHYCQRYCQDPHKHLRWRTLQK